MNEGETVSFVVATAAVLTALFLHDVILAVIATAVETRRRKALLAQAAQRFIDQEIAFD